MTNENGLPERIWVCTHLGEYGHYYPEAVEAEGEWGGVAIPYVPEAISDAKDKRIAELEAKLLNIVSHATCGTMKYKDQSINDVSVQVTKIRNEIYEEGKKLGAEAAEAKLHIYEGRREAVDFINAQDRIAELEGEKLAIAQKFDELHPDPALMARIIMDGIEHKTENVDLQARAEAAEAKLTKAVDALKKASGALGDIGDGEPEWPDDHRKELKWCRKRASKAWTIARTTIAELTTDPKKGETS